MAAFAPIELPACGVGTHRQGDREHALIGRNQPDGVDHVLVNGEAIVTDANVPLSLGLPAICIGLTTGSGAHTLAESINLAPLVQGMEQLYQLVTHLWS